MVILSISVVQGPALAELGIHDNNAKLVTMRIRGIITFSFRQVLKHQPRFRIHVPQLSISGTVGCCQFGMPTGPVAPRPRMMSCKSIARLKPLLSRSAQKFQYVRVASVSPCNAFCDSNGGAPYTIVVSFVRSTPARNAYARSNNQLLSSGPPATASFLRLRSTTSTIED